MEETPNLAMRRLLLDAFYAEEEEEPLRLELWQQRILLIAGLVVAAAFILGAILGESLLGVGCALITAAVSALLWLRLARREGEGYTLLKRNTRR